MGHRRTPNLELTVAIVAALIATVILVLRDAEEARPALPGSIEVSRSSDAIANTAPRTDDRREVAAPRAESPESTVAAPTPRLPDRIVGTVIDADGEPVEGAEVDALLCRTAALAEHPATYVATRSDAGGRFELDVPPAEAFHIRAQHAQLGFAFREAQFAGDRVELQLATGAPLAIRAVTRLASGEVEVLLGARIEATLETEIAPSEVWRTTAVTDEAGRIELARAPSGTLQIRGRAADFGEAWAQVECNGRFPIEIDLVFERGVRVAGRVVDQRSGEGIEGAQVAFDTSCEVRTAADGSFELPPISRTTAILTLRASHDAYTPAWQRFTLEADVRSIERELALDRGVRARGRVVDSSGSPVPGADVHAKSMVDTGTMTAELHDVHVRTDGQGEYDLGPVHVATTYFVTASRAELGRGAMAFSVDASTGDPSSGDLELKHTVIASPARLLGTVRLAAGTRRPHVDLRRLERVGLAVRSQGRGRALLDAEGRFAFSRLAPGRYEVALDFGNGRDGVAARHVVDLAADEIRTDIDFDFTGEQRPPVAGRVLSESGRPVPGIDVHLLDEHGVSLASCLTGEVGEFGFHVSGIGPWSLRARDPRASLETRRMSSVHLGDSVEIRLERKVTPNEISGTVVNGDGLPVTDVYVALVRTDTGERHGRLGILDETGWFRLENLDEIPYTVEVVDFAGRYSHDGVRDVSPTAHVELVVSER